MKIRKGDNVKLLRGRDRGRTGKVVAVLTASNRIVVEGVQMYRKRVRPKKQGQKGETVQAPQPLSASNVLLVCSSCGKPTRVGYRTEGEAKVRYCKKCNATN